jgi:hypothetical protein
MDMIKATVYKAPAYRRGSPGQWIWGCRKCITVAEAIDWETALYHANKHVRDTHTTAVSVQKAARLRNRRPTQDEYLRLKE